MRSNEVNASSDEDESAGDSRPSSGVGDACAEEGEEISSPGRFSCEIERPCEERRAVSVETTVLSLEISVKAAVSSTLSVSLDERWGSNQNEVQKLGAGGTHFGLPLIHSQRWPLIKHGAHCSVFEHLIFCERRTTVSVKLRHHRWGNFS